MRKFLLLPVAGLLLFGGLLGLAVPAQAASEPGPVIVLTIFDPWRMVLGSDSPAFALYDDGTVIYRDAETGGFLTVQLQGQALDAALAALVPDAAFMALDDYYDTVGKTDQPSSVIDAWVDGQMQQVAVYGDLARDAEARGGAPQAYLDRFDFMTQFSDPGAEPWLPRYIEVMLWPYDNADAADWPRRWPDLENRRTVERHSDNYSLFLYHTRLDDLRALAEQSSAVRLDGRTWAFSWRYPFPNEALWMQPGS